MPEFENLEKYEVPNGRGQSRILPVAPHSGSVVEFVPSRNHRHRRAINLIRLDPVEVPDLIDLHDLENQYRKAEKALRQNQKRSQPGVLARWWKKIAQALGLQSPNKSRKPNQRKNRKPNAGKGSSAGDKRASNEGKKGRRSRQPRAQSGKRGPRSNGDQRAGEGAVARTNEKPVRPDKAPRSGPKPGDNKNGKPNETGAGRASGESGPPAKKRRRNRRRNPGNSSPPSNS